MMENGIPELIYLGALMASGFIAGDLAERVGVPRVAAYVAVGALFAESLLGGPLPGGPGIWSDVLTNLSLAVIAFIVGAEIDLARLWELGRPLAGAAVGQSLGVLAAVALALWGVTSLFPTLFGHPIDLPAALIFGAIATATAPAATLAIIESDHARGRITSILFGLVAVDDAIGIVLFTLVIGVTGDTGLTDRLMHAAAEIGLALLAGLALGAMLGLFGRHIASGDLRLPLIIGVIVLNFGLASRFAYSDLLSNIALGLVAVIIFRRPQDEWLEPLRHVRDTIFLIFFTLAGTHFEPAVFTTAFPLIVVYIVARVTGKCAGAWAGASVAGADPAVRRWLGLTLLPQAGVAIGLALRAGSVEGLQDVASLLLNTIIGSTILFELAAPGLARFALRRAGEIPG